MTSFERLFRRKDGLLTDVIGVFSAVVFAIAGRVIISAVAPGTVPYALTYPAVMGATLYAGDRAGLGAVVICQILVWYYILPPEHSFALDFTQGVGLVITTLTLVLTVWAVSSYRTAMRGLSDEKERRLDLLALALREVDHRTKNNFQIAAALLHTQANSQKDEHLADQLRQAANRLMSIAEVHANLAFSSADLSTVHLHDYLRDLCDRVRDGMLPTTVTLDFSADPIELPARVAVSVGLIINECLTNAAKHAFPDQTGTLKVTAHAGDEDLVITVEDDGPGTAGIVDGMGSRLINMLVRPIGATFERRGTNGTSCVLLVPLEQREQGRAES
jgi:two-component sensor histidine kinase